MNETVSVTLPLVPSKNSSLTEITYRKSYVIGVAKVDGKPNQCVVYAQDLPPMAVAIEPGKVKALIFGEDATCVQ